jgi:alanine racemase
MPAISISGRPTWAEIDLTALRHNYSTVHDFAHPASVCAVVKADAYGHGAVECSLALQKDGCKWFAVASTDEGAALRKDGITGRILLLSGFWRGEEETVIEHNLTPSVWDMRQIQLLDAAARKMDKAPESVAIHIEIDTGMTRTGVSTSQLEDFLHVLKDALSLTLEGAFSHFASSEVVDSPDSDQQIARFDAAVTTIRAAGHDPTWLHMANSAAVASRERSCYDLVRPGISLYGYYLPFVSVVTGHSEATADLPVVPVLSWKTRIIQIRRVPAGTQVGYNGAFQTKRESVLATVPCGYADGLSRQLSNRGHMIVHGQRVPIAGIVSMDLTILDVTALDTVDVGDEVIILGAAGDEKITAWEHAAHAQTIPYEVLCNISKRVKRIYVE